MGGDVDFTKGGYIGDAFEEHFKYFTAQHMEYWWQFREILQASDREKNIHCLYETGESLSESDKREFVALSLTNYAVYVGIAEAISFNNELRHHIVSQNYYDARRVWKAAYSSLYTSFVGVCNIVYAVTSKTSVWKPHRRGRNYMPGEVIKQLGNDPKKVEKSELQQVLSLLEQCRDRLHIRSHLDHFWTIWTTVRDGQLLMDSNFEEKFSEGYVVLNPETEVRGTSRIDMGTYSHIVEQAEDYDVIYKVLTIKGNFLDTFIENKKWVIQYADGKRPITKADEL